LDLVQRGQVVRRLRIGSLRLAHGLQELGRFGVLLLLGQGRRRRETRRRGRAVRLVRTTGEEQDQQERRGALHVCSGWIPDGPSGWTLAPSMEPREHASQACARGCLWDRGSGRRSPEGEAYPGTSSPASGCASGSEALDALGAVERWLRSSWHCATMPVGKCVMRTADSILFTCWPPAPPARIVSMRKSSGRIWIATSSASGSTATVAALVWIRPWASVSGTRCTRCP